MTVAEFAQMLLGKFPHNAEIVEGTWLHEPDVVYHDSMSTASQEISRDLEKELPDGVVVIS